MAVSYTRTAMPKGRVKIAVASSLGDPPPDGFRWYRDGALVAGPTDLAEMEFGPEPGEGFVVEVLDDADLEPATGFPGRVRLGWTPADSTTAEYRVEEYVSGTWTARRRLRHEDGKGWYRFESRYLEDVTSHQFRVIAVGTNGNESTLLTKSVLMVRHPDVPIADADLEASIVYDGATPKTVTITE